MNELETKLSFSFETAIEVMKEVCRVNENNPGYIANTLRKMFDESTLTLEQWQLLASASEKDKQWAARQWANHQ